MDSRTGVGFWLNVGILYMTIIGMGMHISEKSSQIDFKQFSNMTITNIKPLWSINIEHGNAIKTLVHIIGVISGIKVGYRCFGRV